MTATRAYQDEWRIKKEQGHKEAEDQELEGNLFFLREFSKKRSFWEKIHADHCFLFRIAHPPPTVTLHHQRWHSIIPGGTALFLAGFPSKTSHARAFWNDQSLCFLHDD